MNQEAEKYLQYYKGRWGLIPDGHSFYAHSSLLQPVIFEGIKAMIKISKKNKEIRSAGLMMWWQGNGAVEVLKYEDPALLLERAISPHPSLDDMAANGADDEASIILGQVTARLHAHEMKNLPELIPLNVWLKDLGDAVDHYGDLIEACSRISRELLSIPAEAVVLHGDIHHKNVLHSQMHGWVAIDPKGLLGDRAFDYANIFCNPDKQTALAPGRLARQLRIISETAGLDAGRLLKWVIAWAACSAIWSIKDGQSPEPALSVAELAIKELKK